jgi:hypothetical protein
MRQPLIGGYSPVIILTDYLESSKSHALASFHLSPVPRHGLHLSRTETISRLVGTTTINTLSVLRITVTSEIYACTFTTAWVRSAAGCLYMTLSLAFETATNLTILKNFNNVGSSVKKIQVHLQPEQDLWLLCS